jgi:hypothetical protein
MAEDQDLFESGVLNDWPGTKTFTPIISPGPDLENPSLWYNLNTNATVASKTTFIHIVPSGALNHFYNAVYCHPQGWL